MTVQARIVIPNPQVTEGTAFEATVYFRESGAATAPTTIQYRVDNLTSSKELKDWTTVTAAVSATIQITSAMNEIQQNINSIEKIQLIVSADRGTTTASYNAVTWKVENVFGYKSNT